MTAVTYTILAIAHAGDHVVAASTIYGGTFNLLKEPLPRYGITTTFVDIDNLEEVEAAIKDNTKLVLIETLGNPLINIPDLENWQRLLINIKSHLCQTILLQHLI